MVVSPLMFRRLGRVRAAVASTASTVRAPGLWLGCGEVVGAFGGRPTPAPAELDSGWSDANVAPATLSSLRKVVAEGRAARQAERPSSAGDDGAHPRAGTALWPLPRCAKQLGAHEARTSPH